MDPEIDLSVYGEWDGVERLLELFPEFRPMMEADEDFHARLPHVVFGVCWWPWLEPQLDGPLRSDLLQRSARLFEEMIVTGNEAWSEVAWLSGADHFLRDERLWNDFRAVASADLNEELTEMEKHKRIPWR